jgi:hypothetical protein
MCSLLIGREKKVESAVRAIICINLASFDKDEVLFLPLRCLKIRAVLNTFIQM